MKPLILASGSPRRAKILRDLGVEFDVVKTEAAEVSIPSDPMRTVTENALAKLHAAAARERDPPAAGGEGGPVLAADTIVWFNGKIYGKPRDLAEARAFLRELSGQTHTVFTGVAFRAAAREPGVCRGSARGASTPRILVACARSLVTFRELSAAAISEYVARVRPLDRAGAYDIDESGDLIVASYDGEYENIMGLPVEPLRRFGII
ncbi:MAG: septum formation protein Maf [Kiritimatiellae bacterium]|nr:septum formation protein Maf [Kiritimatiellia bacterium]